MATHTPPPTSDETDLLLHAYHDGELDPANALAFERRIASEPALAHESAQIAALRRVLRERFPPEAVPPGLRMRIERSLGLPRAHGGPSWSALAASVVLAVALSSGATFLALHAPQGDMVADEVVASHTRALMAPQPIDVASSDRHTVKPWFNGRIPQSPRVVDLAPEDFPLVGGRIDVIGRTPVPTLVYHHRQHVISLLALPAASGNAPSPRAIDGYNVVGWTDDGITYWAVSDVALSDLEQFAQLFRNTPADQ